MELKVVAKLRVMQLFCAMFFLLDFIICQYSMIEGYKVLLVVPGQGSDYTPLNTQVIFPSGASNFQTQCVTIGIVDDNNFEGNQNFQVQISGITPPVASGTGSAVPVTIQDNNGKLCF